MKKFFTYPLVAGILALSAIGSYAATPFGLRGGMKVAPRGLSAPAMGFDTRQGHQSLAHRAQSGPVEYVKEVVNPFTGVTRVVARATSTGTNLYGYLNYTKTYGRSQGWYRFTPDNIEMMWKDPLFTYDNGYGELQTSWVKDNKLCGFDNFFQYGYLWGQTYYEIDLATGEVTETIDDEDCLYDGGIFLSTAYDPEENVVYGYASDEYEAEESTTGLFQKTASYPFGYTVIKEIDKANFNTQCMAMCYNPIDKGLYGITLNLDLVKIDKATGNQTKIAHLNSSAGQFISGMTFSTVENKFYWNPAYGDTSSALVTIDPKTGAITDVMKFDEGGEGFGLLAELGSTVTADSPERPTIESVDFASGATTGTVTFKMPSFLTGGDAIEDPVKWYALLDGGAYSNGTAEAGSEVKVTYSNLASKEHTFGMYVEVNGEKSGEISTSTYVGFDMPSAPANVILEKDNIHWSAVRTGAHGGVIDTDNLEYEVFLNGESVGTTKRTVLRMEIGKGKPLQQYQASVVAKTGNQTSVAGVSNKLVAGDPWELPVDVVASQQTFELMTVINVDGEEGNTWEVDPNRDPEAFYSGQADDGRGDDWLILPAINFPDADKYYSFYITCMRVARVYDDAHLEVCYGEFPDPSSMEGNVIIPDFVPQSRDYATFSNPLFKVPEAGTYYIGLHASTGKDMCGVMVHEIRVEDNNVSPDSPAAVSDLTATAGANGKLEATVSFTMPTKTIGGSALDANAQLTAHVAGNTTADVTGKPGESVSAVVGTVQGDNTISVTVSFDGKSGDKATTEVYTGVNIPGLVKNMTAEPSADMMSLNLKWEAPDAYTSGGYVDPATVDYYLVTTNAANDVVYSLIGTGITEYTYTLREGAAQDLYKVGIEARNAAGSSNRYMAVEVMLGTPYGLPMSDDFEEEQLMQQPWVVYGESNVDWFLYPINKIATEWKDMNGIALCGVGTEDAVDESTLALPRFSTKEQSEVKLVVKAWTGEQSSETSFLATDYGMTQAEVVGTLPYTNSDSMDMWKTIEISLPSAYMGKDWVQLAINSNFGPDHNYTIIDEITVKGDVVGVIGVISGEGSVFAGKGCVNITGYEGENLAIYSVDGKTVASQKVVSNNTTVAVESGIYVVKVGTRTVKLVVR